MSSYLFSVFSLALTSSSFSKSAVSLAPWTLWEIQQFTLNVALFWLAWSQKWIKSGEPFDYIFPLIYFYLHNTAHWQNCSAFSILRLLFSASWLSLHERPDPSSGPFRASIAETIPTTFRVQKKAQQNDFFHYCARKKHTFNFFSQLIWYDDDYIEGYSTVIIAPLLASLLYKMLI